jgi:ABC-type bacteriocin/lantibiotic exporter with double-glycine peptidase domain
VSYGFPQGEVDETALMDALRGAQLIDFVEGLSGGVDAPIEEWGQNLSGGERQRLGLARALYTRPKLLVLDEATSSLDAVTEFQISESLRNLRGSISIVVIAHRLVTIREADIILFLQNGSVPAQGTFSQVRAQVSQFDFQAKLLGL